MTRFEGCFFTGVGGVFCLIFEFKKFAFSGALFYYVYSL